MAQFDDAPLAALAWALESGMPVLPSGPVAFLGARAGHGLPHRDWRCVQPLRPVFEALHQRGIEAEPELSGNGHGAVLLLAPRSREACRAQLAQAVDALAPGGLLLAVAANNEGAGALQSDLARLFGTVQSSSKHRCRIVWVDSATNAPDAATLADWRALAAPRRVVQDGFAFWTRPGLFAWDRIDTASALLAEHLPPVLTGRVADAGAGWGYLSMQLARRCAAISSLDLFEADARALEPARRNLADVLAGRDQPVANVHWHDVTTGLPGPFDAVVMNPPFHVGRADQPELGRAFILRAAEALTPQGELWLVANRHLPYEAELDQRFGQVQRIAERDGFKLIHARSPRR